MLRSGLRPFLILIIALALGACGGDGDTIGMGQEGDLTGEPGEDTAPGDDGAGEDDTVAVAECGDGLCAKEEFETCPQDCAVDPFCGDQYCGGDEDCATCPEDCQGGGSFPTCDTDADCTGGQTCVDIMGFVQLCLSDCDTDADCPDSACARGRSPLADGRGLAGPTGGTVDAGRGG